MAHFRQHHLPFSHIRQSGALSRKCIGGRRPATRCAFDAGVTATRTRHTEPTQRGLGRVGRQADECAGGNDGDAFYSAVEAVLDVVPSAFDIFVIQRGR